LLLDEMYFKIYFLFIFPPASSSSYFYFQTLSIVDKFSSSINYVKELHY